MISRVLPRTLLRRCVCRPASAAVEASLAIPICGGGKRWTACGSASSASRSGGEGGGAAAFRGPATTYEGGDEEDTWLKQLSACKGGFSRSTFVKERRCAEELRAKYCIGEELGAGATAKVYRAVSNRTGQEVAVKVICKADLRDEQMLQSEIQIHKATDHPNILRLLETFEDDSNLYLVTELCGGGDLWKHLVASNDEFSALQMPEEEALRLLQQMVNAVSYLHSRGIVHRDLKPANFLMKLAPPQEGSRSRIIKLTDFGVSAYCPARRRLTKRVGTDRFMAPEVSRNQPYNEKADIFSIGCILHMLLTGHPPKQHDDGTYAISKVRLGFVSAEARELVERLMGPRPEDRPSIEEVSKLPLLQVSRHRLAAESGRLGSQLLDQMYAYSSFPLLKKAVLVAMVSRAESDDDFVPLIEKFLSLDEDLVSGIGIPAFYTALSGELLGEMREEVQRALGAPDGARRDASRGTAGRAPRGAQRYVGSRLRQRRHSKAATERFREDLRADLEQLVHNIDVSGTGNISYSEWLAATVDPTWYTDPQRITAAFRLFDSDGDGLISEDDLKRVIPDVFKKLTVDAVLQESQLCAKQTSWIREDYFSLLLRTQNLSSFTLRRIADGVDEPLCCPNAGVA